MSSDTPYPKFADFHNKLAEVEVQAVALRFATGRKVRIDDVMTSAIPYLEEDGYRRSPEDRHLWDRPTFPMPEQYMERLVGLIAFTRVACQSDVLEARLNRLVAELSL